MTMPQAPLSPASPVVVPRGLQAAAVCLLAASQALARAGEGLGQQHGSPIVQQLDEGLLEQCLAVGQSLRDVGSRYLFNSSTQDCTSEDLGPATADLAVALCR